MSRCLQAENVNELQVDASWQSRHKVYRNRLLKVGRQGPAEGSLQYSPQGSVLAVDTWKCSRGFAALCTCRGGIPYHHWKLVWDHHGEQQSIGMDLEELSFIPLPSVTIFCCWYSNFCMALLGTECSNYEQRGWWMSRELFKEHHVTDTG